MKAWGFVGAARWLFLGSVGLNMFLLGAATVHLTHDHPSVVREDATGKESTRPQADPGGETPGARKRETRPLSARKADPDAFARLPHSREAGPPEVALFRHMAQAMGGLDDARVRASIEANRPKLREARRKIHDQRLAVHTALTKEDFDSAELASAMKQLAEATQEAQRTAQAALVELATKLKPSERVQLEARLNRFAERSAPGHERRARSNRDRMPPGAQREPKHEPRRRQQHERGASAAPKPGPGATDPAQRRTP